MMLVKKPGVGSGAGLGAFWRGIFFGAISNTMLKLCMLFDGELREARRHTYGQLCNRAILWGTPKLITA